MPDAVPTVLMSTDSGHTVEVHVGAHVELQKFIGAGHGRRGPGAHLSHLERHDGQPGLAVVGVDAQAGRQVRL